MTFLCPAASVTEVELDFFLRELCHALASACCQIFNVLFLFPARVFCCARLLVLVVLNMFARVPSKLRTRGAGTVSHRYDMGEQPTLRSHVTVG